MGISSSFMGLDIPQVLEPGTAWGSDLTSSLLLIDGHDHAAGKGAPLSGTLSGSTFILNGNLQVIGSSSFATSVTDVSNSTVLATSSSLAHTEADRWANVHWAQDFTTLAGAIAAANSSGKTLVIATPFVVTTALGSITAPLRFEGTGKLTMNGGGSVTFASPPTAPVSRIFDLSGGGTIAFTAKAPSVYPAWWGAKGDGATDDAVALQACISSGCRVDFLGLSYKTSVALNVKTSGQELLGHGATITTIGVLTGVFNVGFNGSGFVKTDGVVIDGFHFVGLANGVGSSAPPSAISVFGPAGSASTPYTEGAGCSLLKITRNTETGFCFGFAATGADQILITGNTFGGNFYYSALSAGGYCVLLQTCFKVIISENDFIATSHDRHALYISVDPSRNAGDGNVCREIAIGNNLIDWRGVINGQQIVGTGLPTFFEAVSQIRGTQHFVFSGNVVRGGYGGIIFNAENGNGSDISVTGNSFSEQAAGPSERSSIEFTRSSGAFINTGAVICGNTISLPSAGDAAMHGIVLSFVHDVSITGNRIANDGIGAISFGGSATEVMISSNQIEVTNAAAFFFSSTGNDTIAIGKNSIKLNGGGALYSFLTNPANLSFGYVRTARVQTNSTNTPVIVSDPEHIITSVDATANTFGFTITFSAATSGADFGRDVAFTSHSSNVANIYNRSGVNPLVVGVLGVSGSPGALANLPGSTNTYDLDVSLAQ